MSNSGREVNLDSVRVREECVAGWAQGQWREIRIPDSMLTDTTVGAHASSVIYAQTSVVSNTGSTDVTMTNLATVYSNGGSSSDSVTYTVGRAAADLARGGPELTWLVERR
ncbi:hypothetical protein FJY68_10730 [candidate division WOR-3 bacterium]|uniref:Uncharacterized protein n=1 Tax=candidate division WOR-3 bacterium TaxID=2052148 RepID=A0A937XEL8_UNCW3|nr:hypothetical protein [candidate division WOR-3 bacterium]